MLLRALLLLLFLPFAAAAQELPAPLSDTISDYADLLPPSSREKIAEDLRAGRAETGVHVVVVIMESIADFGGSGLRIEDYATSLFDHWGIGDAGRDDGILILVARTDREMRIALGAGYPVIWDNAAQRVIDRYMLPAFRDSHYPEGIEAGVAATYDLIAKPFVADEPPPSLEPGWLETYGPFALFAAMATGMIAVFKRQALADVMVRTRHCPRCGQKGLSRQRETHVEATTEAAGQGIAVTRCSRCGYRESESYTISRISKDDSSSGGFGGGSSSGGGATGRW
jgi:uncharacterized protein